NRLKQHSSSRNPHTHTTNSLSLSLSLRVSFFFFIILIVAFFHHKMYRKSDLEYYRRRYFLELKDDYYHNLQITDSTFRCPFCSNKDYHSLTDLLRHASRIASDSHGETVREIAKHSALERSLDVVIAKDKSPIVNTAEDEFVWPWMVVLANNVTNYDPNCRKYIGKSHKKIKEELYAKGFQPLKVTALWNIRGQTPFVIVAFGKEWDGFNNALKLERSFEAEHCGKRDYVGLRERGGKLFGWMARADDYNSRDIVGKHLRENGDLKTVSGKEAEDNRKALRLVSGLANTLKQKNMELEQTASKYAEANVFLNRVMNQKEEMLEHFNKEISKMRNAERSYLENVSKDHEKAMLELEARRKELSSLEENLQKRQADNHNERNKLYLEKKNNEMAIEEQQRADDKMMRLAEEHQAQISFSFYMQYLIMSHVSTVVLRTLLVGCCRKRKTNFTRKSMT
ncbi:hypothetical protein KIW84_057874, partial [Lathyrus oleraceus]